LYRSGDGSCHIRLQRQHILDVSLILLGPKVPVGGCVDELYRDAHAIPRTKDSSFYERIRAKLLAYLRQRLLGIAIAHHRSPRDNTQCADFRQVGDQFVRHSIGKEFLSGVVRKVRQGENGKGVDRRMRVARSDPTAPDSPREHSDCKSSGNTRSHA